MKRPPLVGLDIRRSTLWPRMGISRYGRNLLRSLQAIQPNDLEIRAIDVSGSSLWPGSMSVGSGMPALRRAIQEQTRMAALTRRLELLHLPWSEGPACPLCPFVVTLFDLATIDNASAYELGFRIYYNTLLRAHMHRATAVIVTSQATLDVARERWPGKRYRLVPLAADPWFCADESEPRTVEPTILYTGGFDKRKRVPDLIEAVARLRARVPSVHLVLSGQPRPVHVDLAKRKLGRNVTFSGYLRDEELAAWYRRAWVVAYPTDLEGFGFPIVEAFASGTPVVATSAGSVAEVAGDAALLVSPGDIEELAEALGRLIHNQELRSSLRAAGMQRAQKSNWKHVARMTIEVYREVLA